MVVLIHLQKEIAVTAIEDQSDLVFPQGWNQIDNRVLLPVFRIFCLLTYLHAHLPVFRERADIHATAGTSRSGENIAMTKAIPHSTMSTHAQAGNSTSLTIGHCLIMGIHVFHQLIRDESLIPYIRVQRAIPIPRILTIRAYEKDTLLISDLR